MTQAKQTQENAEIRYLVKASQEMDDEIKKQIAKILVNEGDMCCTMSQLYDSIDFSERTVRNHISDSELIERDQSQGVSLVSVQNEIAEKALFVAESCTKLNNKNGLPD